jgi:hypothetical protein
LSDGNGTRIELDLEGRGTGPSTHSRRGGPMARESHPATLLMEPLLDDSAVGSDEAARTVGILFLLSALPGLVALMTDHGSGGLIGMGLPIIFGLGMLRGDETIQRWAFAACLVQLVAGLIAAFVLPTPKLQLFGGLSQSIGLLVLVSGQSLSKKAYLTCLAAVLTGTLAGILGYFSR